MTSPPPKTPPTLTSDVTALTSMKYMIHNFGHRQVWRPRHSRKWTLYMILCTCYQQLSLHWLSLLCVYIYDYLYWLPKTPALLGARTRDNLGSKRKIISISAGRHGDVLGANAGKHNSKTMSAPGPANLTTSDKWGQRTPSSVVRPDDILGFWAKILKTPKKNLWLLLSLAQPGGGIALFWGSVARYGVSQR